MDSELKVVMRFIRVLRRSGSVTRHRDEELDGVPVSVEAELRLCHWAVGDEAAAALLGAVVAVHVDDSSRGRRGNFIGWTTNKARSQQISDEEKQKRLKQKKQKCLLRKKEAATGSY